MKRTAFTMIELIFVIVILGILAAVAIPKLASVQDDAVIATEKAVIGAARSGESILRGKRITRGTDFNITVVDLQATSHNLFISTHPSQHPMALNSTAYTAGTASDLNVSNAASAKSGINPTNLVAVVEMDGIHEWSTSGTVLNSPDANCTEYTGPAGATITDANAEINENDVWIYNPKTGTITFDAN